MKNRYHTLSGILLLFFTYMLYERLFCWYGFEFDSLKRILVLVFYFSYILGVMLHFYLKKNNHLNPIPFRAGLMISRVVVVVMFILQ